MQVAEIRGIVSVSVLDQRSPDAVGSTIVDEEHLVGAGLQLGEKCFLDTGEGQLQVVIADEDGETVLGDQPGQHDGKTSRRAPRPSPSTASHTPSQGPR